MKKFLLIMLAAMGTLPLSAQTYDTVGGYRHDSCYYTRWYDTCRTFLNGQYATIRKFGLGYLFAIPHYTDSPIQVKGGVALVVRPEDFQRYCYNSYLSLGYPRLPEYVKLFQYDAGTRTMITLDSARWDTLTPKIMKMPLSTYGDTFAYCYAYEAYFDKPVTVDSTFYIGATINSNDFVSGEILIYTHIPTFYISIAMLPWNSCLGYDPMSPDGSGVWESASEVFGNNAPGYYNGGVLPIVDMNDLETRVAGQETGTVAGGGRYARGTYHDIAAIPNPGYRFQRWNDGVTNSSRIVYLTQDTLFTAYFLENDMSEVRATSTNDTLGTVEGGGLYHQGVTVTLTARPADSCYFVMWTDSVLDNPRSFVLTHDTSFVAVFARLENDMSEVRATSTNDTLGTVEGGGLYHQGVTVTLTARPADSCYFVMWTDSVLDNPRSFVLTHDTSFAAVFARQEFVGIDEAGNSVPLFTLTPNPARGSVTVSVTDPEAVGGKCTLTLSDAAGRRLLTQPVEAATFSLPLDGYPAGTYFLTLATPSRSSTRKLVVE